jgi:peptidyl-prolyl cis-trans isomerase D
MAALGSIRKRGVILICIIGFGLFAFIAEEAFRSCESSKNNDRQQVGEVLGEKISVNDFQKLVDEYSDVIKMQQGTENIPEDQMNQVKDMVWNTYVQSKLVEKEAKKLGLTVTDEEMQNILNEGTNPMLLQTPFVNQQTGRFDAGALKKFLAEYKSNQTAQNPQMQEQYEKIYNYWTFIEKTLRQQTLAQKYQSLLSHCFLSNPVEAKMAFKEENEESQIQLAAYPYSAIPDSKIKIDEGDMKSKYDEMKPRFKQAIESRDIKYIDVPVTASNADRNAIQKQFAGFQKALSVAVDPTDLVHKSGSTVNYLGIPVGKDVFPTDIAAELDSMSVGSTSAVRHNVQDNTLNIVKLIAKQQLPDSIQFQAIQVGGATPDAAHKSADSIYNALKGGANFEVIAKKYGQTGQQTWLTTKQYEFSPSMDKDTKSYLLALNTAAVNSLQNITLTQGNLIFKVLDRKGMEDKYTAAVIKRTIDFSQDTYRNAYNKFSSFVSANQKPDVLLKNAARSGYKVMDAKDITTSMHYVANIHSTRDALKWIFASDEGAESPLYECGDNDHLLVMVLTKIHHVGYRGLDDPQVRQMVKAEVIRDKKADMIMAKIKGVNSIAAAKAKGASVSPVSQITFAAPVFLPTVGASEPALSGAVYATAKGKFSDHAVKGQAGVYLFQVLNKTERPVKFDEKAEERKVSQKYLQYASNFMNELYLNANVVDDRYLFF